MVLSYVAEGNQSKHFVILRTSLFGTSSVLTLKYEIDSIIIVLRELLKYRVNKDTRMTSKFVRNRRRNMNQWMILYNIVFYLDIAVFNYINTLVEQ